MLKKGDNIESHEIDRSTNHRLAIVFSNEGIFLKGQQKKHSLFFFRIIRKGTIAFALILIYFDNLCLG